MLTLKQHVDSISANRGLNDVGTALTHLLTTDTDLHKRLNVYHSVCKKPYYY